MINDQTRLYVYKGFDGRFPKKEKITRPLIVLVRDQAPYYPEA